MSGHGESLSSIAHNQQLIPRKNKGEKTSDTLIAGKESIQEPDKPSKREKRILYLM